MRPVSCATTLTMTNSDEQLEERLGRRFRNPELLMQVVRLRKTMNSLSFWATPSWIC
jgi:hypothetical protein